MKKISLLTLLFLFSFSAFAAENSTDSLINRAIELAKHGCFKQSNEICFGLEEKLSKRKLKYIYQIVATNAEVSGEWSLLYKYLPLLNVNKDYQNAVSSLASLPTQYICRPEEDVEVPYHLDSLFYEGTFKGCSIRIPVEIDGKQEKFIYDNGCSKFSFASESFARSHNIRPIGAQGIATGSIDTALMWYGVCDSLSIGKMVYHNVQFAVVPDRKMENPVTKIDALIGANVLRLSGEMVFDNQRRTLIFPYSYDDKKSNMTYLGDGLQFVDVDVLGKSLSLQLDFGSARTELNLNYYNEHKNEIESSSSPFSMKMGGIGGFVLVNGYVLPSIDFAFCGKTFHKENFFVIADNTIPVVGSYGCIGTDFVLSFDKAILNVDKMYFYVSNSGDN